MGRTEDLARIDRSLKDGEIRLRTVKTNLDALDREISILNTLESELVENVKCLKTKQIIAKAAEYKKAKEDLAKTRARLIGLKNDREHFRKAHAEVEFVMNKAREELEKIQKNGDNNVLHGKFGRKENG